MPEMCSDCPHKCKKFRLLLVISVCRAARQPFVVNRPNTDRKRLVVSRPNTKSDSALLQMLMKLTWPNSSLHAGQDQQEHC